MQAAIKRKLLVKYIPFIKLVLGVVCVIMAFLLISKVFDPVHQFASKNNLSVSFFWNLFVHKKSSILSYSSRTNIAVFGIAGGTHDGANLTDTIMVLSIDFSKKDALMISIPRDIWLDSLKDKVNTALAYGEAKKKGGGLILAKASVEEVIGQPIHYAWVVDFNGFKKIIDLLNGIDIDVKTAFEDKEYPISGKENDPCSGDPFYLCRYETLVFEKGLTHMDGERALKYVRSRHALGDEGTDFARGIRQQQVIAALKGKIFHLNLLQNSNNIIHFIRLIDEITTTDMKWSDIITMTKLYLFESKEIVLRHFAIDWGNEEKKVKGLLINPPDWQYKGAWVLVPRTGNFDEIHSFVFCYTQSVYCSLQP